MKKKLENNNVTILFLVSQLSNDANVYHILTLDVRMQMEIEAGEKEMGELTLNDDVVGKEKKKSQESSAVKN